LFLWRRIYINDINIGSNPGRKSTPAYILVLIIDMELKGFTYFYYLVIDMAASFCHSIAHEE